MGWSGAKPCDDEAPEYAESKPAAMAIAKKPGMSTHFRLLVIRREPWRGRQRRL